MCCILQVEFACLPQQRRLDDENKKKVLNMLALKVEKTTPKAYDCRDRPY